MKRTLRTRLIAGAAALVLLVGTAVAASTVTTKMIEANYMGIKIVVDGVEITPKDANGKVVEPFASEGTTYLPVRAIGEALDKEVAWDGSTATVYVGDVPGQAVNWMTKLPPYQINRGYSKIYDGTDHKSYMTISGQNITQGIYLYGDQDDPGYAIWNTNFQYQSMTFTVGHIDGKKDRNAAVDVYLDGVLSKSYTVGWDQYPQTFTVPLNRAANVKIEITNSEGYSWDAVDYGIYNISFS